MTVEMLEERLQKLAIDAPDAGRISARVLARQTRRRIRVPRLATGFVAFVVLAALIAYFVPAADTAIASRVPWTGEVLRWAGLVGARDRITVVNSTAVSSGYRFTLQGAYADSTRTVLLVHSDPAAMPDGFTTNITDQFARSYGFVGAALNTGTGDMALEFEPLAWPDSSTGARITLHITGITTAQSSRVIAHGTWDMSATLGVDVGQALHTPAPGDLGPAHFRFTSASYTQATIEVDIEITGVSSEELERMVPNGGKGEPALQIFVLDPSGQIINGNASSSGDQSSTQYRLFGFRTGGGGKYIVRVSYYGYGSFDRVLTIP